MTLFKKILEKLKKKFRVIFGNNYIIYEEIVENFEEILEEFRKIFKMWKTFEKILVDLKFRDSKIFWSTVP